MRGRKTMQKKYELTSETIVRFGKTLHRIRALVSFSNVAAGETGGFIEKEENLDHYGNAWVTGNAVVAGEAVVAGNAVVKGNARVTGSALVERLTHLLTIGALGSRNDFTTFMRSKDKNIIVACGCFSGTIDEFAEKVKGTHGDSKHFKTYMAAIELAKLQIDDVEV